MEKCADQQSWVSPSSRLALSWSLMQEMFAFCEWDRKVKIKYVNTGCILHIFQSLKKFQKDPLGSSEMRNLPKHKNVV